MCPASPHPQAIWHITSAIDIFVIWYKINQQFKINKFKTSPILLTNANTKLERIYKYFMLGKT